MKKITLYSTAIIIISIFTACEKVIDLNLPEGEALHYVDAWITTKTGMQEIKFLKAVPYLSTQQPEPIPGAQITVTDLTGAQQYVFSYQNGAYYYDAGNGNTIGVTGHRYKLSITYNGELFEATDEIKRNTTIDSITSQFKEAENGNKEGYYAKLYVHDLPGATDYYWVRTYKNDVLNYYVEEMLSIDGSFNEGISDGFEFIPPFRDGITSGEKPYVKGDKVTVLVRSLSKDSHNFMEQVTGQLENNGLFAEVLHNVPSNIRNLQPGSANKIYGWFGTVAETSKSITIQ